MSLLQSALDFLAGPGSLGGAAGRDHSDFVGQTVELGELRLRVRRVLAEGKASGVARPQQTGAAWQGRCWGVVQVRDARGTALSRGSKEDRVNCMSQVWARESHC